MTRVARLQTICAVGLPLGASAEESLPDGFVYAADAVPALVEEIRYFGSDNFIGKPIEDYEALVCILTAEAADALANVQAGLQDFGLGLKVFDCYRPATAVAHFVRWAKDEADQRMKAEYYPDVPKRELFERGYIAERSGHSRGSTVDLTIIDAATGEELDMGAGFDLFSPLSWPTEPRISSQQRANRMLLQTVMVASGFSPYGQEWWHFTLADEPFPERYFDFPVR